MMYDEYIDRVGEVVTGIVQQTGDRRNILVDLGKVEALLPGPEQVDGERYEQGSRIKAVIREVRTGTKGPQVILSRRDPELIKTLFELEVPEIADGLVEIRGVAREPGYRSKIAVESHAQGVDPVGACVGPRGSRVRMVVSELRGEKIDIIPWNNEPARFVAKALSPARVREVYLDDEGKEATVVVPDDQLALAIGKEGMNARLAARLTGWKIDITSDSEFAQQEADAAFGGEGSRRRTISPVAARRSSRTASAARTQLCRARSSAASRRTRSSRSTRPTTRTNPIVEESEPELEALADTAEPEAVTEDAAAFGDPEPEEFPAGPGDAPVAGEDETLDSGARARTSPARRGRPRRRHADRARRGGREHERGERVTSREPIRTCAGCGRKASQAELQRFHAEAGELVPGAGAGRGAYTCRRLSCFERAATRRAFNRSLRANVRVDPNLSRLYT